MARLKRPVSVDGIEFDALMEESLTLESEVPEYVVESGFSVSDAVIRKAETLEMVLFVTDTPVTWKSRFGTKNGRVDEVVSRLEELYYESKPVRVVTSDKVYTDMAITSINFRKSLEIGYAREIPITFKKIRTTSSRKTYIPDSYGKSGATGASAGTASTTEESSGNGEADSSESDNRNSVLWGAFGNLFS